MPCGANQLKLQHKVDAALVSLKSRFGSNSSTIIQYTASASALTLTPNFEKDITQLCKVAKLDSGTCVVKGKILLDKTEYKSLNAATSLQILVTKMITLKHHLLYKHY